MALCDTFITQCIGVDCTNPMYAGVAPEAMLLNKDQIASMSIADNKISAITMKTYTECVEDPQTHQQVATQVSYKGYCVQQMGNRPFEGSQTEMVEGTYGNKFNNTIVLAVPDNGPSISHNIIDNFANGRFVAILTSDYRHSNGDNKYQVFGASKGLRASSIVREVWGDNESYWIVTLVEENAPVSGLFLFNTDESTTDSAYEALKADCCVGEEEVVCGE